MSTNVVKLGEFLPIVGLTLRRVIAGIRRLKELCHELSTRRAFKVDFGTHVRVCWDMLWVVLPHVNPEVVCYVLCTLAYNLICIGSTSLYDCGG